MNKSSENPYKNAMTQLKLATDILKLGDKTDILKNPKRVLVPIKG